MDRLRMIVGGPELRLPELAHGRNSVFDQHRIRIKCADNPSCAVVARRAICNGAGTDVESGFCGRVATVTRSRCLQVRQWRSAATSPAAISPPASASRLGMTRIAEDKEVMAR
jgi:hypothetical protein